MNDLPNGAKTFGGLVAALVGTYLVGRGFDQSVVDVVVANTESLVGALLALGGVIGIVYGRLVAKGPIVK